ncbi:MAG: AI-2E family transporter [Gemmatimonadota bacterium]
MNEPAAKDPTPGAVRFRQAFLLLLVVGISILFLLVIRNFLLSVFLAAVIAGVSSPLYAWLLRHLGDRRRLAAVIVILVLLLLVGVPLAGFFALVANEAVQVSQGAGAWLEGQSGRLEQVRGFLERLPLMGPLIPEGEVLVEQFRELAGRTGPVLMGAFAAATRGTANFLLQTFIVLYSLYFFLKDGPEILRTILYYIPLRPEEENSLLERFVSVTRATLKGSLLIGVIQGGLAGLAFWAAGVPGAAFWGTVMVVLSIIPAIGSGLVWVPAVLYLFLRGEALAGVLLLSWCVVVVSSVDNFLRPLLIGRDAKMSDLLILLSTLGGILFFGVLGFIVGPIVAALFVTVWHIYGETFSRWLPEVGAPAPLAAAETPIPPPGDGGDEGSGGDG